MQSPDGNKVTSALQSFSITLNHVDNDLCCTWAETHSLAHESDGEEGEGCRQDCRFPQESISF